MINRTLLLSLFLIPAISKAQEINSNIIDNITVQSQQVNYYIKNLENDFSVVFLADAHLAKEDQRGAAYYDYTKRLGGDVVEPKNYGIVNEREYTFSASLKKALDKKANLIVLGGDILNFPSLALVEHVTAKMDSVGIPWMYTAGNHDWHYEGEPGETLSLRDKWTATNLKSLYQGNSPYGYSKIIGGINFLCIDNSDYEILQDQIELLKSEIAKNYPIILFMHIPLYIKGHNIAYECGSPLWKKENDINYKIERRKPWSESGPSQLTYDFRNLVLESDAIIGIFVGHTHVEKTDIFHNKIQYIVGPNFDGKDVVINFKKTNEEHYKYNQL